MAHRYRTLRPLLVLLLLATAVNAWADSGKELFEKQCSGCHSIGGGDGGGPDLKGVGAKRSGDWLIRVIVEPEKLTAEKDPTQLELIKKSGMEMPNLGVSRDDAKKIVTFLGGKVAAAKAQSPASSRQSASASGGKPAAAGAPTVAAVSKESSEAENLHPSPPSPAATPEPTKSTILTPELIAAGRDLFTGKRPFAKGGAPCVSCHSLSYPGINGGALAADLTNSYGKIGENGVRGLLKTLGFPVMRKIYADRPLSEDEITALTALFQDASAKKHSASDPYPLAGLGFFALCITGAIMFKRRIK